MQPADADLLRQAVTLHQAGKLDDAKPLYQQLLQRNPHNPNALNLFGMVHHQQGRHVHGEELIRRAIEQAPSIAGFHNNLGTVLLAQRRLEDAADAFSRATQLQNDYAEAHNNLGVALLGQGKVDEAIVQLVKTLNLRHVYPSARNNLGNALRACYRYKEAVACYRDAIAQKGDFLEAQANLAIALLAMGQLDDAIAACDAALKLAPDHAGANLTRGIALERAGRREDAIDSFRQALRLRPNSRSLRYQIAALTGEEQFDAAPPEYVASLFDDYAQTFDKHLQVKLRYRGPTLVLDALQTAGVKSGVAVADLGCGTGLCGPLLRPLARRLVGVDLSSRMIGQARARNVYDELFVDELTAFLKVRFGQFDVAVAADVLAYIGQLDGIFHAVAQTLKPAGLFAFTLEKHDGEGFALNPTRRYAHSIAYIRSLLPQCALEEVSATEDVLRIENDRDVACWVVVLRRDPRGTGL